MEITNGVGDGHKLKITRSNRAATEAITTTHEQHHTSNGAGFNVETPLVTLTTANESGVLYLENDGVADIVITGFFNLIGASTGGSGDFFIYYRFNTKAGTLKEATTNVIVPVNKNAGSNNSLTATVLYGTEGLTVDSDLRTITSLASGTGRNPLFVEVVIPRGSSVSVSIKPQVGNTLMTLIAALDCYEEDERLVNGD